MRRRVFLGSAIGAAVAATLPQVVFGASPKRRDRLYDTHAHFYTADFDRYPVDGSTNRQGPEELKARVVANPMTPAIVLAQWDKTSVVKGCGVQYGSAYSNDNRYLLDISKAHPSRIIPVVILDPVGKDTPATLERMARENKISGVRFRGMPDQPDGTHSFLTSPSEPVWETANRLGLVVVLMPHSRKIEDRGQPMQKVAELAARYPNLNIVLDHMGFPNPVMSPTYGFFPEHLALREHPNVYYKFTTLLMEQLEAGKVPTDAFLSYAVRTFGADKMMWGSDIGNSVGTMEHFVHMLLEAAVDLKPADRRALFFDTPERIFVPGGRALRK